MHLTKIQLGKRHLRLKFTHYSFNVCKDEISWSELKCRSIHTFFMLSLQQ